MLKTTFIASFKERSKESRVPIHSEPDWSALHFGEGPAVGKQLGDLYIR